MNEIQLTHLPLSDIEVSRTNPRKTFDETELQELAQSIFEKGVLQPILVRASKKKGKYEIIAGERRYRASVQVAALNKERKTIPAIIREMTDDEALEVQIIENLQRKDVHPMEEAVGFLHLATIKKMDAKEIAARVGKSIHYVAQRLKLNSLIEEIQARFYKGHLLNKDALVISTLSADDQKNFYEQELEDTDRPYELSNWTIRKYRHSLSKAPFDLNIAYEGAPVNIACVSCPYNSSCSNLFPDQDNNPVCSFGKCFEYKVEYNYEQQIAAAIADPTVILVSIQYSGDTKEKSALVKKGHTVYNHHDYELIEAPDYPEREHFDGDNDTEAEDEEDFQRAVKSYHDDLKEYQADIASGKFTKALMVDGDEKGATVYIKLRKSSKPSAAKLSAKDCNDLLAIDEQAIKNEIDSIRAREKRAKELDDIKVWDQVFPHFNPGANASVLNGEFDQLEREAIAHSLYRKLNYNSQDSFRKTFKVDGRKLDFSKVDDTTLRQMIRFFMLDILPDKVIYNSGESNYNYHSSLKIAGRYFPSVLQEIQNKQKDIAAKRAARVESRIKNLQQQIKELKKAAKKEVASDANKLTENANKVAPGAKKGKGVKALLKDA